MDILYVIGKGSKKNNLELRMSLRSIEKYGRNIDNVIVAGFPPEWLSDNVIVFSIEDRYGYKHQNILSCIEECVNQGLVKGEFLYSSDDHFYCKETDFDNYPYYIKGELRHSANRTDPFYQYHKSLFDTRLLCTKHKLPAYNYSQHCNTHMHADVIRDIRDIIHESYSLPYGVEPTSLIMNAWQTRPNPPTVTPREDIKIVTGLTIESLYMQIGARECFSIADSVFRNDAIMDLFNAEYGRKSIFEKD